MSDLQIKDFNIHISKVRSIVNKAASLKECFFEDHKDNCSTDIISAHSLQRMGALKLLESDVNGNQSLYAMTERMYEETSGHLILRPIGKKEASTFHGFCKLHDEIFNEIEHDPELFDLDNDKHCFLQSFRAFAIAYHRKKQDVKLFSSKDYNVQKSVIELFSNTHLDEQLEGAKLGLADGKAHKDLLTTAFFEKNYSSLDYLTYEIDYPVPFAAISDTTPAYTPSGRAINMSRDPDYVYSSILTSILPFRNKTCVIIAAIPSDPHGSTFLDELGKMANLQLEKAISWHVLTNIENIFFQPRWFDKLNSNTKSRIMEPSLHSADINRPYLKYNPKKFNLNLFQYRLEI